MSHATPAPHRPARAALARTTTLLDLVAALVDAGASDRQVVASVFDLVRGGRVRLVGQVVKRDLVRHSSRRSDPASADEISGAAPRRRAACSRSQGSR